MDHVLVQLKKKYNENRTLASTPMEFSTTATIDGDILSEIKGEPDGRVLTFDKMIDKYEEFIASIKKRVASAYCVGDLEGLDFAFLLTDVSISDIQMMDSSGGLVVGASLALPAIDGVSHCLDERNDEWRKVHDLDRMLEYIMGKCHSFVHPLKHDSVDKTYPIISVGSRTLDYVMYPSQKIVGGATSPIQYGVRKDQSLEVKAVGPVLLHGHKIDNETAYNTKVRPTIQRFLRPVQGQAVQEELHAMLPSGSYQHAWFHKREEYQREGGCLVPLDEYITACYDFLEQINANRCTTFEKSGLWWNIQFMRDVPCLKFKLTFRVVPIIEAHGDNADTLPFINLKRHVRSLMEHTDPLNMN